MLMHDMAKNAIHFTFCSVNKSSKYILEFGRDVLYPRHGWGLWRGGVGLVSMCFPLAAVLYLLEVLGQLFPLDMRRI